MQYTHNLKMSKMLFCLKLGFSSGGKHLKLKDFISDDCEFHSSQLLQEKVDCLKVVLQNLILQF